MNHKTLSHCLTILVIISSFPLLNTLQLPPKVIAQSPSEAVKVLADDVIQSLKANDVKKASMHLSILNQQLPSLVNSSSTRSTVKVLLDDTNAALKKNDTQGAMLHLSLIKQQLVNPINNSPGPINASNNSILSASDLSTYQSPQKTIGDNQISHLAQTRKNLGMVLVITKYFKSSLV